MNLLNNVVGKAKKFINKAAGNQQLPKNNEVAKNLKSYFSTNIKTIQKNFRFDVDFIYHTVSLRDIHKHNDFGLNILPWHVKSISFPNANNFRMESIKVGPYHYGVPIMDTTGYDFGIVFEEDKNGTISLFIHFLQALIIGETNINDVNGLPTDNGNYKSQLDNRLDAIIINIYNDAGDWVRRVTFNNCFFVRASTSEYSYDGVEAIKYTIDFHSDLREEEINRDTFSFGS